MTRPEEIPKEASGAWQPALALGAIGMLVTLILNGAMPADLGRQRTLDLYFDADICWYAKYMTRPGPHFFHSLEHPFLRSLVVPVARFLMTNFHAKPWSAASLIMGFNAFIWTALLYRVMRRVSGDHFVAVALTLLGLSSAAAVFWLPAPESFPLGSTTLLLAFAVPPLRRTSLAFGGFLAVQLLTLSFVVTHWLAGILVTLAQTGRRLSLAVTLLAMGVLGVAALSHYSSQERSKVGARDPRGLLRKVEQFPNRAPMAANVWDFFLSPLSLRKVVYTEKDGWHEDFRHHRIVATRRWGPGRFKTLEPPSSSLQFAGYALWTGLLATAAIQAFRTWRRRPLILAALLLLLFQFLLHLVFGEVMFLYCLGWMPLFLILIANLAMTRYRRGLLGVVMLLTLITLRTNTVMYYECSELLGKAVAGTVENLETAEYP